MGELVALDRVGARLTLAPLHPPPDVRVRIRRFAWHPGSGGRGRRIPAGQVRSSSRWASRRRGAWSPRSASTPCANSPIDGRSFRRIPSARRLRLRVRGRFHSFHRTCRRRRLSHSSRSSNGLCVWCVPDCRGHRVPRAPLPGAGVTRARGGLESRLEGHYPLVAARTGSCARPSPSPRLRYARCARGLCRFSPVPAGRWPFPTLSLRPLCRCSDPYPAALLGCTCPFLHQGHRPHPTGNG